MGNVFEEFSRETPEQKKKRLAEKYGNKVVSGTPPVNKSTKKTEKIPEQSSHTHPSNGKNVKVEKAYVESTSEGIDSGEGCEEHYQDRYVIEDDSNDQVHSEVNFEDLTEMQKIIVLGDVLNNPLWKR